MLLQVFVDIKLRRVGHYIQLCLNKRLRNALSFVILVRALRVLWNHILPINFLTLIFGLFRVREVIMYFDHHEPQPSIHAVSKPIDILRSSSNCSTGATNNQYGYQASNSTERPRPVNRVKPVIIHTPTLVSFPLRSINISNAWNVLELGFKQQLFLFLSTPNTSPTSINENNLWWIVQQGEL